MIIQLVIQREGAAVPPSPTPTPPPRKKRERQKRKEQVMMIAKIRSPSRCNSCDNTSTILEPESRKVKDK